MTEKPEHLSRQHRALLEPHGEHFMEMQRVLSDSSDEELAKLLEACELVSQTNCGWHIYAAAKALLPDIRTIQSFRRKRVTHGECQTREG